MKKRIQLLLGATLIVFMGLGQAFGQVTYNGNGNTGFGGPLGDGSIQISDDGTTISFVFTRGSGDFNDGLVLYIDSESGGFNSTSGFTDQSDYSRQAISGYNNNTSAPITFRKGFEADFGISVHVNGFDFAGTFELVSGGSHTFVSSANLVGTPGVSETSYSFSIDKSDIGISGTFDFVATYLNPGDSSDPFRSDEAIGQGISSGNPGQSAVTYSSSFNYSSGDESFGQELTGSAGFRLMSSPITTSYSDILDEIWTQGASSGADATNGDPNVFGWKWNVLSPEWETFTNLSANISTGIGFLVYVFADDDYDGSADAFPKTLSVSGTEHSGNVEPNINTDNDVYQLFGNPYASTIDFDNITKTNLTDVAYVWDPNSGGSGEWETWNGTTGDLTDGLIAPFQGFFIETASSGTPDITITEASKSSNGSFLGKAVEEPQKIRFEVEGNGLSNSAFLQFGINGSSTEKVIGDAEELTSLSSSFAQLSFAKADGLFDIANIGNPTEEVTIPLDFTSSTGGIFTLSATDFDVSPNYDLTFHDYKTGESLLIDESFRYSFETQRLKPQEVPVLTSLTAWAIKAKSSEGNRFGITLTPSTSVSIDDEIDAPTEFTLGQNYPNPFNPTTNINYSVGEAGPVNITVYNTMGQKVAELLNTTKNAGSYQLTWNATGVASGIYYYRLTAPGQVLTRQMTLIK